MISIRQGVFETNSSSSHVLVVCSNDDYTKWTRGGELFLMYTDGRYRLVDKKIIEDKLEAADRCIEDFSGDTLVIKKGMSMFDVAAYRVLGALSNKVSNIKYAEWDDIYQNIEIDGKDTHKLFGWITADY